MVTSSMAVIQVRWRVDDCFMFPPWKPLLAPAFIAWCNFILCDYRYPCV